MPQMFLTSLLLVRRGWFANHALQATAAPLLTRHRFGFFVHSICAQASPSAAVPELGSLGGMTRHMTSNAHIPSASRVCVIVVGYLIALFGALSVFRLPQAVSLLMLVAGLGVVALASRRGYSPPRITWRTGLVWVAGSAVILGVLWLIGEDRVRQWTPHPAGYQVVWLICLSLLRHLRHIFHHDFSAPHAAS